MCGGTGSSERRISRRQRRGLRGRLAEWLPPLRPPHARGKGVARAGRAPSFQPYRFNGDWPRRYSAGRISGLRELSVNSAAMVVLGGARKVGNRRWRPSLGCPSADRRRSATAWSPRLVQAHQPTACDAVRLGTPRPPPASRSIPARPPSPYSASLSSGPRSSCP